MSIQLKRGTTSSWTTQNPILLEGQPAVETRGGSSPRIKIGDGSTNWSTLKYATPDSDIYQDSGIVPTTANSFTVGTSDTRVNSVYARTIVAPYILYNQSTSTNSYLTLSAEAMEANESIPTRRGTITFQVDTKTASADPVVATAYIEPQSTNPQSIVFRPQVNGQGYLGLSTFKWHGVYTNLVSADSVFPKVISFSPSPMISSEQTLIRISGTEYADGSVSNPLLTFQRDSEDNSINTITFGPKSSLGNTISTTLNIQAGPTLNLKTSERSVTLDMSGLYPTSGSNVSLGNGDHGFSALYTTGRIIKNAQAIGAIPNQLYLEVNTADATSAITYSNAAVTIYLHGKYYSNGSSHDDNKMLYIAASGGSNDTSSSPGAIYSGQDFILGSASSPWVNVLSKQYTVGEGTQYMTINYNYS